MKGLNRTIDKLLGPLLDEALERESVHPTDSFVGQESVVSRIVENVCQTKE